MKKSVYPCLILLLLVVFISCSKSNESDLTQNPGPTNPSTCDTVNMRFAANIVPILQGTCYTCHSNANISVSGISLEGYNNVKARVDDGRLLGAITHATGFAPMPQGMSKLSDCNINKFRSWINRGAQNN